VGDLQRPLISDDGNLIQGQTSEVTREYDLEGACYQNDGLLHSSLTEGRFYKQRLPSSSPHFSQGTHCLFPPLLCPALVDKLD
jgi:protein phosphatase